jgi:uncharacterized OB-fold protein
MADKPTPTVDVWNKPFWDACKDRRLTMQRCETTGKYWFPPAPVSPFAPRGKWKWIECSGRGTVVSWVVFHQKYFAGFEDELPYNVAMIRLDEGPTLISNIKADNDDIQIGMPVSVTFEKRGEFLIPTFEPGAVEA